MERDSNESRRFGESVLSPERLIITAFAVCTRVCCSARPGCAGIAKKGDCGQCKLPNDPGDIDRDSSESELDRAFDPLGDTSSSDDNELTPHMS